MMKILPPLFWINTPNNNQEGMVNKYMANIKVQEIAKDLKIPVFAVGKLQQQAKSFRSAALFAKIRRCAELEEAVKTGNLQDRLAVELLITED